MDNVQNATKDMTWLTENAYGRNTMILSLRIMDLEHGIGIIKFVYNAVIDGSWKTENVELLITIANSMIVMEIVPNAIKDMKRMEVELCSIFD